MAEVRVQHSAVSHTTLKASTCVAALLYAGESVLDVSLEFGSDLKMFFLR